MAFKVIKTINTIKLSRGNELHIQEVEVNGNRKLSLREFYQDENGNMQPGRNGFTISEEYSSQVIEAILTFMHSEG